MFICKIFNRESFRAESYISAQKNHIILFLKKTAQISFALLYLILTIGVQISTHYCGNYALEVKLYSTDTHKEPKNCCGECESSCCKTKVKEFQINDFHQAVSKYEPLSIQVIDFISTVVSDNFNNYEMPSQKYFISFHSPPINKTNILNCTFRI